jgi:hypothetical protein
VPGIRMVDANRPSDKIAADILALLRASGA